MTDAAEVKEYEGSCQCGAVRFSARTDLEGLIRCNCSRCRRMGFVLKAVPADHFVLHAGQEALTEFRFNTRHIEHLFCATCGVEAFARGVDRSGRALYMVNVNCLPEAEYDLAAVQLFDGRAA